MSILAEKLRPMTDWILVKRDPVQARSAIIVAPGDEGCAALRAAING